MLLGAVGGPKWDGLPFDQKPERGLAAPAQGPGRYANLRPALCFDALKDASTLKPEIVSGLDILIVRELMGGVYFGEPKETTTLPDGQKRAVDTGVYTTSEIERICRVAFDWRGCAATSVRLGGKIQCDGDRRVVEGSRHRGCTSANIPMCELTISWPTMPPCSWCAIPSNST